MKPDHHADRLADQLRRETARLAWIEQRLDSLRDEHGDARWYQPGRRAEVERRMEGALAAWRRSRADVERLRSEFERRPPSREPRCWRASDPLAALQPPAEIARRIARERRLERSLDRDIGLER